MSSTIRPISRRFPYSKSLWEETNLPMCAILTPLSPCHEDPLKLANLIRCLQCGAPHPTIDTYDLIEDNELIFCHLCGATCSYKFEEQLKVRTNDGLLELQEDGGDEDWPFIADEAKNSKGDILVDLPLFHEADYFSESPKACPPVWWIVLDGTMPQSSAYWKTVTDALHDILVDAPDYAHIGLLLAGHDALSTWDLSSPVPRVSHYPLAAASGKSSETKVSVDLNLTPMDPLYEACVEATLRAVSDNPSLKICDKETGMALGATIETILEFMEDAKHPGDALEEEDTLLYAGGKITCLLGRPPLEIENLGTEPQSFFGLGGMGGAIHDPMDSDKFAEVMPDLQDSSDLTPSHLASYCKPLQPSEDIFDIIGTRCAHAALGVDICVVEPPATKEDHFLRPFYGLPLLRVLSDTSGAPGPLLLNNAVDLTRQVRARTPWQPGMAFATEMRIRTSPGWGIETSPIEPIKKATHQLAIFLSSSGISGPAIATNDDFYLLGTCDKHTSLTLDLQNTNPRGKVNLEQKVYGLRGRVGLKVTLKPVIQTCVASTTIKGKGSSARVVRRMKISCCPMPMAMDVESIYNSIDPEALAAALFHKLALNVYEEGTFSTQQVGIDWLKALLVCVYQSALNVLEDEGKKKLGMPGHQETDEEYRRNPFDASRRLLTSSGDEIMTLTPRKRGAKNTLDVDDVLLGQGHRRVAALSLVVFSLLQCDALRPSPGVSADARCAAIAQMASMTPRDLVKCIAPSLSLWSAKEDTAVARTVDLSLLEAIKAMKRNSKDNKKKGDLIFVLDSPQQVLVYKGGLKEETKKFTLNLKPFVPTSPKLTAMIDAMTSSYRVQPFSSDGIQSETASYRRFVHNMIEDMPSAEEEGSRNFKMWQSDMAQLVQAELEELGLLGA